MDWVDEMKGLVDCTVDSVDVEVVVGAGVDVVVGAIVVVVVVVVISGKVCTCIS